jgi:hypothetical protein
MSDLRIMVLAIALAAFLTAAAQENLETSYDWLSAGAKVIRGPYYLLPSSPNYYSYDYPYHPYYPYNPYSTLWIRRLPNLEELCCLSAISSLDSALSWDRPASILG